MGVAHKKSPKNQPQISLMMMRQYLLSKTEGVSSKRGQVPFEYLGDHIVGIKQNFGT